MSSIGDKSVFETFERMTEQIEHEERKLIAAAEVNEDLSGDYARQAVPDPGSESGPDQQLIELKPNGAPPGGVPGESKQLGKGAADAELVEDDDAPPERPADTESSTVRVVGRHVRGALCCAT